MGYGELLVAEGEGAAADGAGEEVLPSAGEDHHRPVEPAVVGEGAERLDDECGLAGAGASTRYCQCRSACQGTE